MTLTKLVSLALATALTATACGGSQPAPESAPAPTETAPPASPEPSASAAPSSTAAETPPAEPVPSASATPAQPAWKDMSIDQKKEVMKTIVLPTMKTTFQGFDAKLFADVTCVTCHGEGAKQGKFTMPNAKLPKLDPAGGFAKHMKKAPKVTKFMMEQVAPTMSKLLDIPPYDPSTKEGFGCFNCHTMAGK